MKFNFKVDKANVALNMIENRIINKDFANFLWEKYNEDYIRIKKHQIFYTEDCSNMPIIQEVLKYKDFENIYNQTLENCKRIEENLKLYKEEIETYITQLCKTELPNLELDISIVPWGGVSFFGTNYILWGHEKGKADKFYDLVYLYHEALHKVFSRGNISHCIIQELTDTKLAKHFHPELEDGYEKHAFIQDLQNNMKPLFDLYYGKPKKEVLKQLKTDGKQEQYEMVKRIKKDFSKLNIFEFEKIMLKNSKQLEKLTQKQTTIEQ